MMGTNSLDFLVLAAGLTLVFYLLRPKALKLESKTKTPPGPNGLPIVGNLFDIPTNKAWLEYRNWGEKYGPISYAESLGVRIVVLNTYPVACELLDKRSSIYSGRPSTVMLNELMGWGWLTAVMSYGERLRKHRWVLHRYLQSSNVKSYERVQTQMSIRLLSRLLDSPDEFLNHIRNWSGSVTMMVAYGHEVAYRDDPFITLIDEALRWVSKAQQPGAYLVDFLPFLRYIPEWFPGTAWKNDAKIAAALSKKMLHVPYNVTKEKFLNNTVTPCIMSDRLTNTLNEDGKIIDEDITAEVMAMIYAAGADTVASTLQSAILALVLNPNILRRAQDQLDSVTGMRRLPTFEDRTSLPYIEAILQEAHRWNPVVPIGSPHMSIKDDIYNGHFIPSGTTIIPNQWAMLHDEKIYPEAFKFIPERWLDEKGKLLNELEAPLHPHKMAFGFGRRLCPGKYFADNTLFIAIANVVATLNMSKRLDENGCIKDPVVNFSSGVLSHPDPFECSITPRSSTAEALIRQAFESTKII